MSFNDNPDLLTRTWLPYHRNLIYLVKSYPIAYHTSHNKRHTKLEKTKWDTAWLDIGTQLCEPIHTCKQQWTKIKYRYAKIMSLINTGEITKEAAMSHPETAKFFDGLLSFMDPFLSKITGNNIPLTIHKSINNIFGLNTKRKCFNHQAVSTNDSCTQFVTHSQVKALLKERQSNEEQDLDMTVMKYLQIIVDTAVKQKLEKLLPKEDDFSDPSKKGKPNSSLVRSKNILNNDEETTTKTGNLGLETELIIEDDIKWEAEDDNIKTNDEDDVNEENITLDKNKNNTADEIPKIYSENILPITQILMPGVHDTMENTTSSLNNDVINIEFKTDNVTVTDNNEPPVSDDYIRNFFNELGEVLSLELSTSKQKTLKSRINELLIDILVKEEDCINRFTILNKDQIK